MKSSLLDIVQNLPLSPRGEYELTDAMNIYVQKEDFYAFEIKNPYIDVGYPWDILSANAYFLQKLDRSSIAGEIEEGVTIKGKIILEE